VALSAVLQDMMQNDEEHVAYLFMSMSQHAAEITKKIDPAAAAESWMR